MKWLARAVAAVALAVFASAFGDGLPHSPSTDIAVAAINLAGLALLGWYARWSSLWMFSVALVVVTAIHEHHFWYDDPRLSGMDDLGPTTLVLALPAAWVVLAVGAGWRAWADRRQRGGASAGSEHAQA